MDKSILAKLIMLLFAITILSTLLNSCNSKDNNSMDKMFSKNAEVYGFNETQSLSVDAITGSTVTYNGIIVISKKALENGGLDVTLYEHNK